MIKSQQQINNPPSFGMKFQFKRLSPKGDWYRADREFFNSTYQIGIISSKVDKLKPKNDKLILTLDLPESDCFPTFDEEKGTSFFDTSYKMFVDIIKSKKKRHYDLSEKNIRLDAFDATDRLEIHPLGPFNKLLEFISKIENK